MAWSIRSGPTRLRLGSHQFLIGVDNEVIFVFGMSVSDPDCSSAANRAQYVRPCSYDTPHQAIGYAMHSSRSHDAVIRVYDDAGNVIETHEHAGDFKEP